MGPSGQQRGAGGDESAFKTYLPVIRAHWVLVAVLTLATLAGSMAALSVLKREYRATSQILVTPLHITDETFVGLGLLRDTGDPARTAQTAARLVESPAAAELAAKRLGRAWDGKRVLGAVRVEAPRQSNVLAVSATAGSAELAARIANEFARATLDVRERLVERQLRAAIEQLRARVAAQRGLGSASGGRDVTERLTALEAALDADGDPTLSLAQSANVPRAPIGTQPWRVVAMALLAGLLLGAVAALVIDSIDRRVRHQEDLAHAYPLPTLAAIPPVSRRARKRSFLLPPDALDAFHTVRAQLEQLGTKRSILVTSASSGDGRTTTAANLALAMVEAGQRVLLMDLDLRKPELAAAVGVRADRGLGVSLDRNSPVTSLAVESPRIPGLLVVPAAPGDRVLLERLTRRVPELLSQALEGPADYAIIDAAPLGEVSDALQLAGHVDDVVVVARPGHTERASLLVMRDLLERSEIFPRGMVVIGQELDPSTYYHQQRRVPALERVEAGR